MRVRRIKLQCVTALAMLHEANRSMIRTGGIGLMATCALQLRTVRIAHGPRHVQLMIEAKGIRIFSPGSKNIKFGMVGAEISHETREQRAGQIRLRTSAAGFARMFE